MAPTTQELYQDIAANSFYGRMMYTATKHTYYNRGIN